MARERRVDQVAGQRPQALERTGVIGADQPAVAGHVGIDDRDQLAPVIWRDFLRRIVRIRNRRSPPDMSRPSDNDDRQRPDSLRTRFCHPSAGRPRRRQAPFASGNG